MVPWGTGNPISPGYLNTLVFLTGKPPPLSVSVGGGSMSLSPATYNALTAVISGTPPSYVTRAPADRKV